MIIKGNRTQKARNLAIYLLRLDENQLVYVHTIEHYPQIEPFSVQLKGALRFMEVEARAKGKKRTLYHSIIALRLGEILNIREIKAAIDQLAKNLGLEGHNRVIIEHRKNNRQHFHILFNILHPKTGRQAKLSWTRINEWRTARQLEEIFGFKTIIPASRSIRKWEIERGKRSGINPFHIRKEITALYRKSSSGSAFLTALDSAGYTLTVGRYRSWVLVDKAGDIHGLMRRIEGAKLKDLKEKFQDLIHIRLPLIEDVLKQRILKKPHIRKAESSALSATSGTKKELLRPNISKRSKAPQLLKPKLSGDRRIQPHLPTPTRAIYHKKSQALQRAAFYLFQRQKKKPQENQILKRRATQEDLERSELIEWAIENGRTDILAQFGIYTTPDILDPV